MKRSLFGALLPLAVLAGCAAQTTTPSGAPRAASVEGSGQVLRLDGQSVVLGQAVPNPLPLQVFVARVQQAAAAGRDDDVRQLVGTYPDLAEQAVLSADVSSWSRQTIAAWLDALAAPAQGGWSLLAADREDNAARYTAWEARRTEAWAALRRGAFADVADEGLRAPADSPTPWPAAEAAHLRATALLAAGRPAEAAQFFDEAARTTSAWDKRFATRSRLFASMSHELAGDLPAAERVRSEALDGITMETVDDPMILRLLLEAKELAGARPDGVTHRAIRARLGRVEMQRGAPQAALLAWRAAELDPGAVPTRDRLRLGQVEALLDLGQEQPAIAMLSGLALSEVRAEALSMLGLVQLRRGQVDIALAVFREAVDTTSSQEHPGVYADAGLALLSTGNREAGLALLHEARDVYRERADRDSLRRLLANELRYAQATDDVELATEARQMLLDANR